MDSIHSSIFFRRAEPEGPAGGVARFVVAIMAVEEARVPSEEPLPKTHDKSPPPAGSPPPIFLPAYLRILKYVR